MTSSCTEICHSVAMTMMSIPVLLTFKIPRYVLWDLVRHFENILWARYSIIWQNYHLLFLRIPHGGLIVTVTSHEINSFLNHRQLQCLPIIKKTIDPHFTQSDIKTPYLLSASPVCCKDIWISNHMPIEMWDEITYPFPFRYEPNLELINVKLKSEIDVCKYFQWKFPKVNATNPTDDMLAFAQVMGWCRQATSHCMSQCWPRSMSPYGVNMPQCVNWCHENATGKVPMEIASSYGEQLA